MIRSSNSLTKVLYSIILLQFIGIVLLLGGLSNEYLSNVYMRAWVAQNAPLLDLLLSGPVDALLIGVAAGGTILLIRTRLGEARSETARATPPQTTNPKQESSRSNPSQAVPAYETKLPMPDPLPEKPEDVLSELEKQEA